MSDSVLEQILVEQRVAGEAPSVGVAYAFCLLLGLVSAHRFYLRRPFSAVLQVVSYFLVVGFFWLLLDLFLIPGMAREERDRIRTRISGVSPPAPTSEEQRARLVRFLLLVLGVVAVMLLPLLRMRHPAG